MSYDMVIEGGFADPVNGIFIGYLGVQDGRIAYLTEGKISGDTKIVLSDSEIVLPGFIDTHVHFREPGSEHKGDIASESRAAAAGGVTTAMEMPNTPIQTTSRERVLEKQRLAEKKSVIDLLFYGGIGPGNLFTLKYMADVVPAFKLFMCESTGNLMLDTLEQIEEAFSCLSGLGKPLAVHCEDQVMNKEASKRHSFEEHGHLVHSHSRPPESEVKAIKDALSLSRKYSVPLSVCHVSTREGMEAVKRDGLARSEATIHHTLLSHDDLGRLGGAGKMNPPIRHSGDSDFIMESVLNGDVSFIGTDHAPHTIQEKAEFMDAPSGIPATEFYGNFASLLISRGVDMKGLVRMTSYNAAEFFQIEGKGRIEEGFLADLVILDTKKQVMAGPPYFAKCGWSPFEGMEFPGSPTYTIRRGRIIFDRGRLLV